MGDETFVCSVDVFLEKLAPFSPDARWVDSAYGRLKKEKMLGRLAETALPVEEPQRRIIRNSVWEGLEAGAGDARHGVDAGNADTVQWEPYRNMGPQQVDDTKMNISRYLEKNVKVIQDCRDPDEKRNSNEYRYSDCPSVDVKSDFLGANLNVDAVIANPDICKIEGKTIPLAAAQTAVVMEFAKPNSAEMEYEIGKQLVAAANHIMNDDPRRNWMYGITIEDTDMSLWYFSRSYSMKSAPFNFTKDFKTFIRVFLSFIYANDEELGDDSSISRKYYEGNWCYVYKLETEAGPKYYRTLESLYNPRSHRMTGRKSRVWKVIQVVGMDNLAPKLGEHEVVLKDCWVYQGSLSEKEIQGEIFKRLKSVKETDYAWAPLGLRDRLKDGLTHPETYFIKVLWDWKEEFNMDRSKYRSDSNLASDSTKRPAASWQNTIVSTQTPRPITHTLSRASNAPAPVSTISQLPIPGDYRVKQHYRVVYADVGECLAYATSLSDAMKAFEDIFIALTLLFLAGWVHRDVSEGNIILVRGKDGVRAKLNDLEYAQFFSKEDGAVRDPKTGTAYFMPMEIHKGTFLFRKATSESWHDLDVVAFMNKEWEQDSRPLEPIYPSLRHNFAHDLESLWWIIVWILLIRVKGAKLLLDEMIFTVLEYPHPHREDFFRDGDSLHYRSKALMHDTLRGCKADAFLAIYSSQLCHFYYSGERQDPTSYHKIYSTVWAAMELLIGYVSDISMELEYPTKRSPPSPAWIDPEECEKRKRPADYESDRESNAEDGSSRKRQKSDGDVFINADEEDTAAEDTVQDMAEIVNQDSNPQI